MDYTVHGSPWNSPARILERVTFPFSRGSSQPRIKPTFQADSLPAEPQGKPKNTGAGSLSFLQRTFLAQESNHSLLHCRRILYQLAITIHEHRISIYLVLLWYHSSEFLCIDFVCFFWGLYLSMGFPDGSDGRESACNEGDPGSVP